MRHLDVIWGAGEGKVFLSVKQKTDMLYFVFPMTDCYVEDRPQEDNNIGKM